MAAPLASLDLSKLPDNERACLAKLVEASRVVDTLRPVHPDLPDKLVRVELARHGHAMSVPVPGLRGHPALAALRRARGRVRFAHADLAGYSVFEEAFTLGDGAAV